MKISTTPSFRTRAPSGLRHARPAFSLVELLVVIGIIALLISMLMPALGNARERANSIKCQAQQRQIVQGLFLHAGAHAGYMPLTGWPRRIDPRTGAYQSVLDPDSLQDSSHLKYAYYQTGDGGYHLMSLLGALAPTLRQTIRDDSLAHVEEDLQRGVIRELFTCPSDVEGGRLGNTVYEGGSTYMSFALNDAVFTLGGGSTIETGRYIPPGLRGKLSRVPKPSETFLLTDAKPRADGQWMLYCPGESEVTLRDALATTIGPANNPHASSNPMPRLVSTWDLIDYSRHRGNMNVAFADGHVEHVPITEGALSKISINEEFPGN